LTFGLSPEGCLDQLAFLENGPSWGHRKAIFKESDASPASFEPCWADRPPDLHQFGLYADRRLGTRRRQDPLVIRRNPRPIPAVSTAQINLLSLKMATGTAAETPFPMKPMPR